MIENEPEPRPDNTDAGDSMWQFLDDQHEVPHLGGAEEDEIIRSRLRGVRRRIDGPSLVDELARLASQGG